VKNALVFAILLYCLSLPAQAARVINSVLLNGSTTTNVAAGETVTVAIEVTTSGGGNNSHWKSTSYVLVPSGSTICVDTDNETSAGIHTDSFDITAPTIAGSYNISFYAHRKKGCDNGSASDIFSVPDGIVVSSLIAEYRFDETEYNDTPNEITDSVGGFHGQAKGSQPVEGKVCNAIDLSATGTTNYAVLDKDILTGKTDFTISLWSQTSKTSNQSILSGAGNNSSNELIMWFTNHTSFRPYLKASQNGVIATSTIADDNWQHLVWTREGDQNCLFVDKELKGCVSLTTLPLDIQSLILGQEQDSVGGSFSSSQAFDGLLDELLIFGSAITSDEIASIYDNQNAGLGYDGSTRDCPIPAFPSPVLDLHFDELNWDADDSIIDISGNDYHANAVNVTPTEGFICKAADLTATGINDYITLDSEAMNNLSNFSISLWYQTPKTGPQSIISGSSVSSFNELIFWFTNNTLFSPHIKGGTRTITTSNISDDVWHHLVWTRSGSRNLFYRDGVLQTGSAILSTGALNITSLILGQEQDSLGGSFDASQSVEGLVDELLIFEKALTAAQVLTVFDNESAGLNFDGTPRDCPTPPAAILNMQFDESSWSGAIGEVIDETGNFNGQSKNGADTALSSPAIVGNPGTCGYGTFDGLNDYVALPTSFENQQGSFTITAWINPSNLHRGSRIFADDENNTQGYAFSLGDPGSGKLRFYSRGVSPVSVDTLSAVISADRWTFVTAVHNFDTKSREIYVNGIAQIVTGGGTSNTYTNTWGIDTGIASIGGETDSGETANRFTGAIDEVRMYNSALSRAEIEEVYRETHPCDSFIDHFEINTLNAQGITCEADDIIIKACADASCSTVNPDAVDVKLSINGVENKTVTVSGSNGTSTSYSYTTVGNAALSLDQDYECKDSNNKPCIVDFKDSGFIISDIPMQISGKPSSEGFNATTLSLRAVETNTTTGACINTFPNDTDVAVNLSYSCAGGDCEDLLALGNNGNSYNLTETATPRDLYFSTDSTAIFTLNYPHAGKFIINAQKDVEVEDTDGNKLIKDFSVSSNAFVERPFGFKLSFVNDANKGSAFAQDALLKPDASGSVFKKAGESFTLTATAMQWINGQDEDGVPDGVPDDFTILNNSTLVAGNFADEKLIVTADLLAPSGGNNPTLGQPDTLNSFASSMVNNDYKYYEVGVIKLNANLNGGNYLGGGNIRGEITNVGRFIPDKFELFSKVDGDLQVLPNTPTFAYVGQKDGAGGAIKYSFEPEFIIKAVNVDGDETKNYTINDDSDATKDFMKLTTAQVTLEPITTDDTDGVLTGTFDGTKGVDDTPIDLDATISGELVGDDGVKGELTFTMDNSNHFSYHHISNSRVAPFTADIDIIVNTLADSDGVTLSDTNAGDAGILKLDPTGVNVRFGRWYIENTYGPETSDLPLPMQIQHWDGGKFITNDLENLTAYDGTVADNYTRDNTGLNPKIDPVAKVSVSGIGPLFSLGVGQLLLTKPSDGSRGQIRLTYETVPAWLQYDWDGDGNFDNNPSGIATFGLFRGNDRIIYQREIHR
jgi:MSHA biogenesis protein MshQ